MGAESSNTQHPTPNTRLYRTGDLVRYLCDGQIEFLGRIDGQVKVRGFRIELGEIEATLACHPQVWQAVVVAREDIPGDTRLVAYVVPKIEDRGLKIEDSSSDAPDPLSSILYPLSSELRDFLKDKLPDYMVPSVFVTLDALPLTPNGKLDRRALPMPDARRPLADEAFVSPRTPTEELVAGIWGEVLRVTQVGIHDNFFALGGHSLLATQVIARLRDAFQVELPIRALFEAPTPAQLAARITSAQDTAPGLSAPPLVPLARGGALPLSFAQQRLWFLDQLAPGSATYTIPMPVRLTGSLDLTALQARLNEIVRRHETLRTSFATLDGLPIQLIAAPAPLPLAIIDL